MFSGCPRIVRSDYGTENCYLAASQVALRSEHIDTFAGEKSFRYGKSTTNTVRNGLFGLIAVHLWMSSKEILTPVRNLMAMISHG